MCHHFGTALDDSVIKVVSAAVGLSFVGNCQVWIQELAFSRQLAKQVIHSPDKLQRPGEPLFLW
jgi:hypothetical protein